MPDWPKWRPGLGPSRPPPGSSTRSEGSAAVGPRRSSVVGLSEVAEVVDAEPAVVVVVLS